MKIISRGVIDWETCKVIEQDCYDYEGPVAECKSAGSAPTPTDPYEQAGAQYGLATGTAAYNAALNRTDSSNPLGSNTWDVTGYSGAGTGSPSSGTTGGTGGATKPGPTGNYGPYSLPGGGAYGFGGSYSTGGAIPNGSGAPMYSQQTSLTPWANQLLQSPIDTSQIPGMPGGPSLQSNVNQAQNATFANEMQLLQPQEQQQGEQTQAQLEAEGAMPGSAAYGYGEKMLGLSQGAENANAANQAVTTGYGELPMLYGLGSTSLQNQLAERNAPISEYESLSGNASPSVSAATPDISGAFGQQYQGALNQYNANTATNNANTQAGAGLVTALAMMLAA